MKRGYDRVGVLYGGFDAWLRRDLPTQAAAEAVSPQTA
jgi:3-mercaptopyruvate sulfurtransferase SseA